MRCAWGNTGLEAESGLWRGASLYMRPGVALVRRGRRGRQAMILARSPRLLGRTRRGLDKYVPAYGPTEP